MEIALAERLTFLNQYPPFNLLPEEAIIKAAHNIEISYFRAHSSVLEFGSKIDKFYIIRSGEITIFRRNGDLYDKLDEGGFFGQYGLQARGLVRFPAKTTQDTLLYYIPAALFNEFYDEYDLFSDFVEIEDTRRLKQALENNQNDCNDSTTAKVKTLLTREAVFLPKTASIRNVAKIMAEENVSAILLNDPTINLKENNTNFVGIITEHDLCVKVIGQGLDFDSPVDNVMSSELISLDRNAYIFEAMLIMLRANIHHLPILKNKHPIGVIDVADIVQYESQSSLLFVRSIFLQQTLDELVILSKQLNSCFVRMVNEDANSHMVGRAMSEIGRCFKQRLLELAEEFLGLPPVPYCFLALGSLARDEQLIVTDQDNAIILDNNYDHQLHNIYFEQLAKFVCDGLARCGYKYCTGDIMSTNPQYRKTQTEWETCFANWIDSPNSEALLNCSIFFDICGVFGRVKWAEHLNAFVARRAKKNNLFLASLAHNALNRKPPLGFFKNFVMEKDGKHRNSINLKRRGTAPMTDLIRVHALAIGSQSQNSFQRLEDIIEAGILPSSNAQDLLHAMELIFIVRIRHQALDIEAGDIPDNNIEPENMSDFERRNLKDAFLVLSNAQNFLKCRYSANELKIKS